MERDKGLYYPDDGFKSEAEIKRKLALEGNLPQMRHETPVKVPLSVDAYLEKAGERARQMEEMSPRSENYVKAYLPRTSILNMVSDLHYGHPTTDTERIRREIEVIKNTPDSYLFLLGDLVEGIHWGGASGAEQSQTLDEQQGFLNSLFRELGDKVIVAVSGEHDSKWAARTGSDPYRMMAEQTKAPYVRGVAEVELDVGGQTYLCVAQHKALGSSIYNKNHPTFRESRFDLQNGEIYVSAHTHRKQISQETIRKFNQSTLVTHISTGPYKTGDEYGDRSGYAKQLPKQMYGVAVRVHADRKLVEVNYDILEAHRQWAS